ncbi:efflux RND transporter periplasmic adaptor subunit [Lusitaniella coriacea LEGE 07157]|uniref:Efflux RND transporter periplasmic adaptor subunit n=1 Tax=Lusitaniella coriacea LEGE 07157 TaxID=945747 RepID=A0A8J7E101_9CYAN|nr:efflux RND transporter periplasmic adaptor subunit [Lusitaniella coriacea]MBE9118501.1 efflux RND transporter periplasmic adaptor subunit [Lusitaniella coriacea LEGE 07157]
MTDFNVRSLLSRKCLSGLLTLSWLVSACGNATPEMPQAGAVPVTVDTVRKGVVEESAEFNGKLEAKRRVVVRPQTDGQITAIAVNSGDAVEAGKLIVQLKPQKNQAEVNAAVSNVNVRQASLNSTRAELNGAKAEESRAKAQVQSAQADLQSQIAEVQRQQAEVKLRQEEFKRSTFLVSEGVQPQQELDEKKRNLDTAIANLKSQQALRNSRQEALNGARAALRVARQRIKGAEAALDRENARVREAEAQVGVVSEDLDDNRITAPISGIIGDISAKVGDYVEQGNELTSITQNSTLELRLSIPVERADQLRLGLPVELVDTNIRGQISFISPQVDSEAQSILAKATFTNDGNLRDGQFVRARVIWNSQSGILIPMTAVSRIGGQAFVFLVEDGESQEKIARQQPISLGALQGGKYPVLKGLEGGEKMVTEGILKLSDGAPIDPNSQPQETETTPSPEAQ